MSPRRLVVVVMAYIIAMDPACFYAKFNFDFHVQCRPARYFGDRVRSSLIRYALSSVRDVQYSYEPYVQEYW